MEFAWKLRQVLTNRYKCIEMHLRNEALSRICTGWSQSACISLTMNALPLIMLQQAYSKGEQSPHVYHRPQIPD